MQIDLLQKTGVCQEFPFQESDALREAVRLLRELGIRHVKTRIAQVDAKVDANRAATSHWHEHMLRTLAENAGAVAVALVPDSATARASSEGEMLQLLLSYGAFVREAVARYGRLVDAFELGRPHELALRPHRYPRALEAFGAIVDAVRADCRRYSIRPFIVVEPAPPGAAADWISALSESWIVRPSDPIALSAVSHPGSGATDAAVAAGCADDLLAAGFFTAPGQEIWVTEAGYLPEHGRTEKEWERRRCHRLRQALAAPVARVYWSSLIDIPDGAPVRAPAPGGHADQRPGLVTAEYHRTPAFEELKTLLKSERLPVIPALV